MVHSYIERMPVCDFNSFEDIKSIFMQFILFFKCILTSSVLLYLKRINSCKHIWRETYPGKCGVKTSKLQPSIVNTLQACIQSYLTQIVHFLYITINFPKIDWDIYTYSYNFFITDGASRIINREQSNYACYENLKEQL